MCFYTICFIVLFSINTYAGNPTKGGDIVGRENRLGDELLPGWADLGHLGLYDANIKKIIQITGSLTNTVIDNSGDINDFKVKGLKYWGAKYVGTGKNDLNNIVKVANDQRNYDNVDFATSSTAVPGQVVSRYKYDIKKLKWVLLDNYKVKPKFRCDTFVNWAHLIGNSQAIVTTTKKSNTDYDYLALFTKKYTYDQFSYKDSFLFPADVFASSKLKSR